MKTTDHTADNQARIARLMALKRYETMSAESRVRIRAGVLREIRSPDARPVQAGFDWELVPLKWALGMALLLLGAGIFLFQVPVGLEPVTAFTASEEEVLAEGLSPPLLLASNSSPIQVQFAPVSGVPVNYER